MLAGTREFRYDFILLGVRQLSVLSGPLMEFGPGVRRPRHNRSQRTVSGKSALKITFSLFIVGVFAAVICTEKNAEAQNGPWCAYYNDGDGGSRNCGFATLQQCLNDVRGIGGNCGPSPYPSWSGTPSRRRKTTTAYARRQSYRSCCASRS
jgi:hypothetical protein